MLTKSIKSIKFFFKKRFKFNSSNIYTGDSKNWLLSQKSKFEIYILKIGSNKGLKKALYCWQIDNNLQKNLP